MTDGIPEIHALWVGDRLGNIEGACLQSFLRHGHKVTVHCYTKLDNLPPGIVRADAADLVPDSEVFRHRETGSLGMFASQGQRSTEGFNHGENPP